MVGFFLLLKTKFLSWMKYAYHCKAGAKTNWSSCSGIVVFAASPNFSFTACFEGCCC